MTRQLIDNLEPGTNVTLIFQVGADKFEKDAWIEDATFLCIQGEGDNRQAKFHTYDGHDEYDWYSYRYNGRWVYGSGADRLSLARVEGKDNI